MSDPYAETEDAQDARMCRYFYEEKGDVEDYCDWPKIRERLLQERPEVPAAVEALKVAQRTLVAVLKAWEVDAE